MGCKIVKCKAGNLNDDEGIDFLLSPYLGIRLKKDII